jgi:hypothetical protein
MDYTIVEEETLYSRLESILNKMKKEDPVAFANLEKEVKKLKETNSPVGN